ncbi:hypothetical protein DES49_3111 [Halospina denitrificans]|uniref:Uncharacterized protein n=1 Tax=Halospina denitrificans TaxID=332522 RepID=A0A4R7JG21_9GAMM|nr:hypothetical protein DES49_3111 [Halospina denitrificans]
MQDVSPHNKWQDGDRFSAALRLQIGTCAKRYAAKE